MVTEANFTSWNTIADLVRTPNEINSWFWTTILALIWMVALITMQIFGFWEALLTSSFIAFLLGTLLLYFGVVSPLVVGIFFGIMVIGFLFLSYSKRT